MMQLHMTRHQPNMFRSFELFCPHCPTMVEDSATKGNFGGYRGDIPWSFYIFHQCATRSQKARGIPQYADAH